MGDTYPPKCPSCKEPLKIIGFGMRRFHCLICDLRYRVTEDGELEIIKVAVEE